jgi:hypothetical protein
MSAVEEGDAMRPSAVLFTLLLAASPIVGCTSTKLRPGTGDIAFRLRWSGPADLDLRVEDPNGHELSFIQRRCEGDGVLDIDCNATPEEICRQPIENIYWAPGRAPEGVYRYKAVFFNVHEDVSTADYELQVLLGDQVVERRSGLLTRESGETEVFEYHYRRASR